MYCTYVVFRFNRWINFIKKIKYCLVWISKIMNNIFFKEPQNQPGSLDDNKYNFDQRPCKFFLSHGGCKFGTFCKFSHNVEYIVHEFQLYKCSTENCMNYCQLNYCFQCCQNHDNQSRLQIHPAFTIDSVAPMEVDSTNDIL